MSDEKHLIIHFNNGAKMELSFPTQVKNSMSALVELSKRVLESDKLVISVEGRLLIVPWSSVQHVEASAVHGAALPVEAIRGAKIVGFEKAV